MADPPPLIERVVQTVRRHGMLAGGETVLVCVSGGADSVTLLHALKCLAPEWSLSLHVLHVNHGLRPESDGEASFVTDLARSWGLPVSVERLRGLSPGGRSLEAEARAARYQAFRRVADRISARRVALGHTGDDQAETVLMRLLEGAGPRGLAGIPPVRGIFIRPLIEESRDEILSYCRGERLEWIEDPSNLDPKFLRNRLRHELLPFLASAENPRIVEALRRVGRRSREAVESLEILAEREWERLASVDPDGVTFPLAELREMPPGLLSELLRLAKGRLHAHAPLRESDHQALQRFMRSARPSGALRAADIVVERGPSSLRLSRAVARPSVPELALPVPGSLDLPFAGLRVEAVTFSKTSDYAPPAGSFSVAFDTADLPERLIVRGRRSGDRFQPFGSAGAKPLKKFLIDQRVPRWERSRTPLVLAGNEILWVVGVRRGEGRRVIPSTKLVLELRAIPR